MQQTYKQVEREAKRRAIEDRVTRIIYTSETGNLGICEPHYLSQLPPTNKPIVIVLVRHDVIEIIMTGEDNVEK